MGQGQHFEHPAGLHLVEHGRAGQTFQGVEDGLRPGTHFVALATGEVTEILAADGVKRTEDHHLALGPAFQHSLQARAQRQRRLAGAGLAAEGDDAHRFVEEKIQGDPLLGGASPQSEDLAVTAHQLDPLFGVDPSQRMRTAG